MNSKFFLDVPENLKTIAVKEISSGIVVGIHKSVYYRNSKKFLTIIDSENVTTKYSNKYYKVS